MGMVSGLQTHRVSSCPIFWLTLTYSDTLLKYCPLFCSLRPTVTVFMMKNLLFPSPKFLRPFVQQPAVMLFPCPNVPQSLCPTLCCSSVQCSLVLMSNILLISCHSTLPLSCPGKIIHHMNIMDIRVDKAIKDITVPDLSWISQSQGHHRLIEVIVITDSRLL